MSMSNEEVVAIIERLESDKRIFLDLWPKKTRSAVANDILGCVRYYGYRDGTDKMLRTTIGTIYIILKHWCQDYCDKSYTSPAGLMSIDERAAVLLHLLETERELMESVIESYLIIEKANQFGTDPDMLFGHRVLKQPKRKVIFNSAGRV